jgi:hypothetical protein
MAFRASDRSTPLDLIRDLGSNASINHLPPHQDLELLVQRRRDHDRWRLPARRSGSCGLRTAATLDTNPKAQPSRPAPRTG